MSHRDPGVTRAPDSVAAHGRVVLELQRATVRAFRRAEEERLGALTSSEAVHTDVGREAQTRTERLQKSASDAIRAAAAAAREAETQGARRRDAAIKDEIVPALKRGDDALDAVLPALDRVKVPYVASPRSSAIRSTSDASARLCEAVSRIESAVDPVLDAVRRLERHRLDVRHAGALVGAFSVLALTILFFLGIARYHRGVSSEFSPSSPPPELAPVEEREAVREIRRLVRELDALRPTLELNESGTDGGLPRGSVGIAYSDGGAVRIVRIHKSEGLDTDTYYQNGDVIFRYEHVLGPKRPTDGARYYYRLGTPVRVRRDTITWARGTQGYSEMDPDSVRSVALRELQIAQRWHSSRLPSRGER